MYWALPFSKDSVEKGFSHNLKNWKRGKKNLLYLFAGRRDIQQNDTLHNDAQQNDAQ